MRIRAHIATSAVLAGILYSIFRSMPMSISAFLSGVLIDLDHVLEGYLNYGLRFNVWSTIKVCENAELKKNHVFLHSYELLLIYVLAVYWLGLGDTWYGIALGMSFHILLDRIFNSFYTNMFFLTARWKKGFEYSKTVDVEAQKRQHRMD